MFQIVVSVIQPMKRQFSSLSEHTEAWRSENDSLANAQYRKNKGQERQVIWGLSTGRAQMLCIRLSGKIGQKADTAASKRSLAVKCDGMVGGWLGERADEKL